MRPTFVHLDSTKYRISRLDLPEWYSNSKSFDTNDYVDPFINSTKKQQKNIILHTVEEDLLELFQIFINAISNDDKAHLPNLLYVAIVSSAIDIVEYLVKNGADLASDNHLAIRLASGINSPDILDFLIKSGADPTADDNYPLCMSINMGYAEQVKLLVENGADVSCRDNLPLKLAVWGKNTKILDYLIKAGANIHFEDEYPVRICLDFQKERNFQILLSNGADITKLTADDVYTIISFASLTTIKMLDDMGLDFSIANNATQYMDSDATDHFNFLLSRGMAPEVAGWCYKQYDY
jgi:ankyrin repeat protein